MTSVKAKKIFSENAKKSNVYAGRRFLGYTPTDKEVWITMEYLRNKQELSLQVDSGFNHLIRPMFYGSHHDIINISNPNGKNRFYTVVGYICETDTFANNRRIPEISEGDILAFKNAGAYCFTMSSNYNSRYRPAEVLLYKNNYHLIRKKENMTDILNNQILIDIN